VEFENRSGDPVEIDQVDTSCDCLLVKLSSARLDGGKRSIVVLDLDLAGASDFTGNLVIDITGLSASGKRLFSLKVHVDVRPAMAFAMFGETESQYGASLPAPAPMP